ncbi:hypothetical protein NC652_040330 [Populus alba x Populus x berolinensis]|nr:hypothetical protein NC652_040330 [Populus alba x Populus x berolinensis]
MERQQELLSTEIVNRGVKNSGPYAGSLNFSVRVLRGFPDFLNSANLKYVEPGYSYLLSPMFYFLTAPVLIVILSAQIGKLFIWQDFCLKRCLQITEDELIELANKSGKYNDAAIKFQHRALKNSGIGDETYMPRIVFQPGHKITLKDGREEAAMVMFGAVDDLLAATKIRPKDMNILIVNCGILNTTPSLSSIGNDMDMLLPSCFFRMGAAAMLLSSCKLDRWRSKYEMKRLVRTHQGVDNRSFKSMHLKEDAEGR